MNKKCVVWLLLALLLIAGTAAGCKAAEPKENCRTASDHEHKLEICTDKVKYYYDETVYVHWTITNVSEEVLEFNGGSRPAMDICDSWGACWSDSQKLTPEQMRIVLEPGEAHTIEWTWPPSPTYIEDRAINPSPSGGVVVFLDGELRRRPNDEVRSYGISVKYYPDWSEIALNFAF